MSSRKWPPGARVIERRLHPGSGVVTNFALLRHPDRHVVGTGRSRVILLMAAIAGGRQAGVVVICVALRALHTRMSAG